MLNNSENRKNEKEDLFTSNKKVLNKKYENIFGLSCVENQVLVFLKEKSDISQLYNNSAVPLNELFFFLVIKGIKPYEFYRIPRIQDELKEINVLTIKKTISDKTRILRQNIRNSDDDQMILMRVTPQFTKEILNARGFREDHFVRVIKSGNGFIICNDIPAVSIYVSATHLGKIYDGEWMLIQLKNNIDEITTRTLWENRIFKPENNEIFYYSIDDLQGIPDLAKRLCNMITIYKIMRYQLADYYKKYVDTSYISMYMPIIERYLTIAQYNQLRNNISLQSMFQLLCDVNSLEIEIMSCLKKKLEGK